MREFFNTLAADSRREFSDTIPVYPRRMSPEDADEGVRASWPVPPLKLVPPIAAESATEVGADDTDALPGAAMAVVLLVGLATMGAALVAAAVLIVLGVVA